MEIDLFVVGGLVLKEDISDLEVKILNGDKLANFLLYIRNKMGLSPSLYNDVKLRRKDIIKLPKYIFTEDQIKYLKVLSRQEKLKSIKNF